MENIDLYNTIIDNPIYLSVAVVLILLLIYSILKKFIKLIFIAFICIAIYLSYLYYTGDPKTIKDVDSLKDTFKDRKELIKDKINDNLIND